MNGLIVGFTSSLPLLLIVGPVSLMVLDTGLTTGVRGGWPAPLGVAGVDLAYASATAAAGLGLQRLLNEHQQALGWGGGLALMVLAAYLLTHARSQRGGADSVGPTDSAPAPMAVQVPVPVPVPMGSSGPLPTPSAIAAGRADAPRPAPVGLAARFAA
ncbi:MAG: LysE family transporter, partial [Candidatus Microthrix subdominans]